MQDDNYVTRILEISIRIGLLVLLSAACILVLRPFLPLLAWGIIIAIAIFPVYRRLEILLRGHAVLAAVVCTFFLFTLLILPVVLLTGSLVESIQNLALRLKEGTAIIPPPPTRIETWPLVGVPLKELWDLASKNLSAALRTFAPQIRAIIPQLLLASAGIGLAVLQWIFSILVSGVLLANAERVARIARSLFNRLFGDKGPEFEKLVSSTIGSVSTGIIGVAVLQSFLAGLGFLVAGLPGAGLWSVIFLFAAVLQLGGLVLVPAVIYMFAIASVTKAVIFLIWCLIVGIMDNVLKPLLLGRGVAVPMAVVFLGSIGGFVAMETIGLFVGAVVLAVGYKLLLVWLEGTAQSQVKMREESASARAGS